MPEVSFPGLYFTERGGVPVVSAPSPSIGAFECMTKRGVTDRIGYVTSWSEFTRLYGDVYQSSLGSIYGPHCVKQFFDNGGSACWIARVLATTAVTATLTVEDAEHTGNALTFSAVGGGEGSNDISLKNVKQETTLNIGGPWGVATTNVTVTSVNGFQKGDIIYSTDGTNEQIAMVHDIDYTNNHLVIVATGVAVNVADGSPLYSVSTHRVNTTLAAAVLVADTTAVLTDASRVTKGMILSFHSGAGGTEEHLEVASKLGNTVTLTTAFGNAYSLADLVVSQEFDLEVYESINGSPVLLEEHNYLNFSANSADYIVTRLAAGTSNESSLVSCALAGGGVADTVGAFTAYQFLPGQLTGTNLASGDDNAWPAAADWQGANAVTGKTGLYLFDNAGFGNINFFSLPDAGNAAGTPSAVFNSADTYAQGRWDTMFIAGTPSADDTAQELYEFRVDLLGLDSSYTALYGPWVQVSNPFVDGHTLDIPPEGTVQGVYSAQTQSRGVYKAPANVPLRNVLGLTAYLGEQDQALVNPVGVNLIRDFGERGFRIYGARTLWTVADGFHYVNIRRLLTYIRVAIQRNSGWVVFEPNNQATRSRLVQSLRSFLTGQYRSGALYTPDGAPIEGENGAFYIKCDGENNPPEVVEAGNLICDIGVRPTPPAEFVTFNLALISGTVSVSEG